MQHITQLSVENVKRLTAVTITPDGNMVIIGGANGAGKSSVLDAIEMALGGQKHVCDMPIHAGAESARIVLDTDDGYVIERTFTEHNTYLKIKSKEGYTVPQPQALLDRALGDLSFDPLAFTRMKPAEQVAVFMSLLGLDFSDLDKRFAQITETRRDIGRDGASVKAQLEAIPLDKDAPTEEVVVSDLVGQLEQARAVNTENARKREALQVAGVTLNNLNQSIEQMEQQLVQAKQDRDKLQGDLEVRAKEADACVDIDTGPISEKIASAETTNQRIRQAAKRKELADDFANKSADYAKQTAMLKEITDYKAQQIADADFPVDGVTFGADGILVNGIPFDQASSAEQLKIATAMGLSGNPELRIILIRDGSLLDESSLAAMAEMAEKYQAQVFLERVGEGQEVAIIIEDGMVKEDRTAQAAE